VANVGFPTNASVESARRNIKENAAATAREERWNIMMGLNVDSYSVKASVVVTIIIDVVVN
jgi:hypothetical protein